ncbi:MAG: hypothetical protein NVS3B19_10070 [Ginsengibacter sp.]
MEVNSEKYKLVDELKTEVESLRSQLTDANDTIDAIRTGKVDALIVNDEAGLQVFTLKSADQTYRLFIEKMKEGAVTINKKGFIIYANTSFASMVSKPLNKVIGSLFMDYIPNEFEDNVHHLLQKGWESESKGETCLKGKDGKQCPFLLSLSSLDMDEGESLSIVLADLSVQKEHQTQLREKNEALEKAQLYTEQLNEQLEDTVKERTKELLVSREHFKFLSNNIPVIVWTAKPNGEVDYLNNRWYEFTGEEVGSSLIWEWQKRIHPDDLAAFDEAWKYSLETGATFKNEFRFKSEKGMYKWYFSHALPFKNEKGEIIAWVGTFTDIEDQKLAMLKKDEFISLASHELKTPVTSLKAFTQILQIGMQEEGNARAVDYLGRMDRQINKLTHLISDLLDVTKINAGKIHFNKEVFAFNKLVEEIVEEMQRTSLTHHIMIHVGPSCDVNADRNRIGQVITNLLSNAIKYSPQSEKIILTSELKDGKLSLFVEDFGIGIAPSEQGQLFTRFFRGNDERVKTFPGLGLGLYISNEIVKRHKGILSFESTPGKGSKFCMTLPCSLNND